MRLILFTSLMILLLESCNQNKSSSSLKYAATDIAAENLKGNPRQIETDIYNIDSTGKTDPLDEKNIEKYDSSGYTVSYISMNGKDSIKFENKNQHTPTGFITAFESTGGDGKKKSSMTVEYDSAGNYKIARSYDSTGKMDVYYTSITSNKSGLVTSGKGYHPDSTLKLTFTNDFDSIYYVGGTSKDSVGKITYSGKIKLNDKKDVVQQDETTVTTDPKTKKDSSKNTVTTYKYDSWDKLGNWTQQTSYNDKGKPIKVSKRIITYRP